MRQHVFAFLVALAVWTVGNAALSWHPARAQGASPASATGIPFQVCEQNAQDYEKDRQVNCVQSIDCPGSCSRKVFHVRRCKWAFEWSSCTEQQRPTQYRWQTVHCIHSAAGCVCSNTWSDTGQTGTESFPQC